MSKGEVLTMCGYRCDLCLAYAPNVASGDRRPELSDGWFAVYGFRIQPEQILCEGCVSSDNPALIDKGCPVRPCVVAKGIPNCASCPDYVCDKLGQRIVDRAEIEGKLGRPLGDAEYERLVRPYESRARLDALRRGR
jgi:hypothetical protein